MEAIKQAFEEAIASYNKRCPEAASPSRVIWGQANKDRGEARKAFGQEGALLSWGGRDYELNIYPTGSNDVPYVLFLYKDFPSPVDTQDVEPHLAWTAISYLRPGVQLTIVSDHTAAGDNRCILGVEFVLPATSVTEGVLAYVTEVLESSYISVTEWLPNYGGRHGQA